MTNSLQNPAGRDRAIDVAKGLGMLLVMLGHTCYQEPMLTVIYSFHMPLFFILSGMLFRGERYPTFRSFLGRKAKTLLLPWLIFVGITLVFTCAVELWENGFSGAYLLDMLKMAGKALVARSADDFKYNAPLWFVPCLFLTECFYYYVSKIKHHLLFVAVVAALFAGGWALAYTKFGCRYYVWNFPAAMFAIGFYALGHRVIGPARKGLIERGFKKGQFALVAVAGLAAAIPLALINGKVSLGSDEVGIAPLFLVTGLFGSAFVLGVAELFTWRGIEYIGRYSFDYMAFQSLVRTGFTFALMKLLAVDFWKVNTDYRYSLPAFAVVFVGTTVIVLLKNRVFRQREKA